ncbi:hypothetical protein ACH4UR_35555 [Streptomyces lydicus]|uniref:hypothetical protein n=1 Tax=Streptomyces lydicus TaxID=47763 RepID=UPI0033E2F040
MITGCRRLASYYDYYQPEAYVPQSDTYIEKDSSINEEVERLRHSATDSLSPGRDVVVVASENTGMSHSTGRTGGGGTYAEMSHHAHATSASATYPPVMKPHEHPEDTQVSRETGTGSLALGVAAVAVYGSPVLAFLPRWIRFVPVYLGVPLGICAIVLGVGVLWGMRGDEGADRRRARAGVALGTVAIAVPIALLVWLSWALHR